MNHNTFTPILLEWFSHNGRDLPWRHTHDAYAIWLSEVILQQTRIDQGRAYWLRFMERFPHVEDLAQASEDEVLRLWQGLGYYSRARNLHQAARQIMAAGRFPNTMEGILKLKGVGDYTAAAIASIAFGLPEATVDGNAYRVLARYFGIRTPINTTQGKKLFKALAQDLLPVSQASTFNQALMDFGAVQCTPAAPRCEHCPLNETCEAYRTASVAELPVKNKTLKVRKRHLTYIYIRYKGMTAIRRREEKDIWQGLWEPLLIEDGPMPEMPGHLTLLRRQVKHVLTHQVLLADFYLLEATQKPSLPEGFIWIREPEIEHYALPRLVELLIQAL